MNHWLGKLFFRPNEKHSTKGMGAAPNLAKYRARGIIRALRALAETGIKVNIPFNPNVSAIAKIEKSRSPAFDYWLVVPNLWEKCKVVRIPLKSHKALNKALKNNWKISQQCEFKWIKGELFVYVFVSKEVPIPKAKGDCLGADVGINKSVTTSDGHKGESLKDAMAKARESQRERFRQRMKFNQVQKLKRNYTKTRVKQILDREAKRFVSRCRKSMSNAVVENRKILNNLRTGKLNRWARCYFANRVEILCKESSVFFLEVNPFNSSKTCSSCRESGKRELEEFVCQNSSCSEYLKAVDSDFNAAKVLTSRGRTVVEKHFDKINFSTAIMGAEVHN